MPPETSNHSDVVIDDIDWHDLDGGGGAGTAPPPMEKKTDPAPPTTVPPAPARLVPPPIPPQANLPRPSGSIPPPLPKTPPPLPTAVQAKTLPFPARDSSPATASPPTDRAELLARIRQLEENAERDARANRSQNEVIRQTQEESHSFRAALAQAGRELAQAQQETATHKEISQGLKKQFDDLATRFQEEIIQRDLETRRRAEAEAELAALHAERELLRERFDDLQAKLETMRTAGTKRTAVPRTEPPVTITPKPLPAAEAKRTAAQPAEISQLVPRPAFPSQKTAEQAPPPAPSKQRPLLGGAFDEGDPH